MPARPRTSTKSPAKVAAMTAAIVKPRAVPKLNASSPRGTVDIVTPNKSIATPVTPVKVPAKVVAPPVRPPVRPPPPKPRVHGKGRGRGLKATAKSLRNTRNPRSGLSLTPEMLQRIAEQRIVNRS